MRDKLLSTCLTCIKAGIFIGGVSTSGAIAMSYVPIFDLNYIGNRFQIYGGRGFGFHTQIAHVRHSYLMKNTAYRAELPKLIDTNYFLTDDSINRAIRSDRIHSTLTIADRVVLGIV